MDLQTEEKTKREMEDATLRDCPSGEDENESNSGRKVAYKSSVMQQEKISRSDIEKVKEILKLEGDVEKKLNRIMKKG